MHNTDLASADETNCADADVALGGKTAAAEFLGMTAAQVTALDKFLDYFQDNAPLGTDDCPEMTDTANFPDTLH